MVRALVLYSNGEYKAKELKNFEEFQKEVGGYLELLPTHRDCNVTCYVNEEGLLMNMPTSPWTPFMRTLHVSIGPVTLLRGNILLFGKETGDEGDETPIESDIIESARLFHNEYL